MPGAADETALGKATEARRAYLRIDWQEVARRAGISIATLGRARREEGTITIDTKIGLEHALLWEPGSVDAILAGGEPTITASSQRPEEPEPGNEWPLETQRRIAARSVTEILDLAREIMETGSDRATLVWLYRAARTKLVALGYQVDSPQ